MFSLHKNSKDILFFVCLLEHYRVLIKLKHRIVSDKKLQIAAKIEHTQHTVDFLNISRFASLIKYSSGEPKITTY